MGARAVRHKSRDGHKALAAAAGAASPFACPTQIFGEDGSAPVRPFLSRRGDEKPVPMRAPIHYTYPEMFGNAEVTYAFPPGKLVRLASGGASRVEALRPGHRFRLDGGGTATVTQVDPLIPWPEADTSPTFNREEGRRVVGRVKHAGAIVLDVTFGGKTVTTTPNHLFWSVSRNDWIAAGKLRRGELLKGSDGQAVPVGDIGTPRKLLVDLYNLEVEVTHTYFVGDPPVLVHNGYDCLKLPEYEQELMAEDGLNVRTPRELGLVSPEDHHIFPQEYESWFSQRGLNIDEFTITPEGWEHDLIHGPLDWNETIMQALLKKEADLGTQLTADQILEVGEQMLKNVGLDHLEIHPYRL